MHPTLTILVHVAAAAALSLGGIVGQSPALETRLLALAAGSNLPATVSAFRALEEAAPAPADLLRSSPERLDGRWSLVATVAATVGEDLAESVDSGTARASVVNTSGVVVDASEGTLPVQEVDVKRRRIGNEVVLATPLGRVLVRVAGAFEPAAPPAPGTRATVSFDSLEVFTEGGGRRLLSAGWVFALARAVNPALANGADDASWLETTYLSDKVRLGRGNKGSIFVLRRLDDGGGALAAWPL